MVLTPSPLFVNEVAGDSDSDDSVQYGVQFPSMSNDSKEVNDLRALVADMQQRLRVVEEKAATTPLQGKTVRERYVSWVERQSGSTAPQIEAAFLALFEGTSTADRAPLIAWRALHQQLHTLYGSWSLALAALKEPKLFKDDDRSPASLDVLQWVSLYKSLLAPSSKNGSRVPRPPRGKRGSRRGGSTQAAPAAVTSKVTVKKEK